MDSLKLTKEELLLVNKAQERFKARIKMYGDQNVKITQNLEKEELVIEDQNHEDLHI